MDVPEIDITRAQVLSAAKTIATMLAILGFVVSFVGMLFFPGFWGLVSFYAFVLGAGYLFIPAFVYLFGKSLGGSIMTPLARILYTIAAITVGGLALDQREYGEYEAQPLRKSEDGTWQHLRDGKWVDVENGREFLTRLGTKPFALTYEKTETAFKNWLANVEKQDTRAITDGGQGDYYILDTERAGGLTQLSPVEVVEKKVDGFVIRMEAIRNSLRGAGGTGIADKSQEEAMKDYGGNTDMQTKVYLAYVIVMALLAIVAAVFTL